MGRTPSLEDVCAQNPYIMGLKVLPVEATHSEMKKLKKDLTETKGIGFSGTCNISGGMRERDSSHGNSFSETVVASVCQTR